MPSLFHRKVKLSTKILCLNLSNSIKDVSITLNMNRETSPLDICLSKFLLQDATLTLELLPSEPGPEAVDREGPDLLGEFLPV